MEQKVNSHPQVGTQVDSALRQIIVTFAYFFFAGNLGSNESKEDKKDGEDTSDEDNTYEEFESEEQLNAENQAPPRVNYTHYLCKTENCSKFYTICTCMLKPLYNCACIYFKKVLNYINHIGD